MRRHALTDEQWEQIFRANGLGPVEPLVVGTEEQLLATLDAKPLTTWEDWIVAIPARILKAREQAAKQLEPKAVRVFGNVGVVQYAAMYVTEYGDGTRSGAGIWRKFTHTWLKTDGQWQIITGMCAAQKPRRRRWRSTSR